MARERALAALAALAGLVGACSSPPKPPPAPPVQDDAPAFRVDVDAPASCIRAAKCEVRLRLTALGPFKVNAEYPMKFVADPTSLAVVDGPGTFTATDAKAGTHTIVVRADEAITYKVAGTFKLSVCTDEICKIETSRIELDVPVSQAPALP
jgi:hypothetical protein